MNDVLFIVHRDTHDVAGRPCRWAYVQSCPHGEDIGAVEVSETGSFDVEIPGASRRRLIWEWHDVGNGRCRISPSLLVPKLHNGLDCHFGLAGQVAEEWQVEHSARR
jgi:hypothetical protein